MSACSIIERIGIDMINPDLVSPKHQQSVSQRFDLSPKMNGGTSNCVDRGGGTAVQNSSDSVMHQVNGSVVPGSVSDPVAGIDPSAVAAAVNAAAAAAAAAAATAAAGSSSQLLERDYYGCYCLKFIVKNGTHTTEDKVLEDFGAFGDVVDVRGPGLFSGLRGNHVYVR